MAPCSQALSYKSPLKFWPHRPPTSITARIQSPWIISRALPDLSYSLTRSYFKFEESLHHIRTHLIRQQTLSSFSPAVSLHSCFFCFCSQTSRIRSLESSLATRFISFLYSSFDLTSVSTSSPSLHHIRTTFHPWAGSFRFHWPFRLVF